MGGLLKVVAAIVLGIMLGLLYTIRVLDVGNRTLVAGPWKTAPNDGTPDIDPYTLAANDRSGLLPLGSAEGLSFVATTDSGGGALSGACDYVVLGPMPPARFWTVSLLDRDGFPLAGPAERHGFTSAEVLRILASPVRIDVAPDAHSGNWLPTETARDIKLMLRLYDTGLSTVGTVFDPTTMPKIVRGHCR